MKRFRFMVGLGVWLLLATQVVAFESEQISIQVEGSGPDVILIHGFGCSPEIWSGVAEKLSPRFKLHIVRMAGFAGTPAPKPIPESCLATLRDEILRYIHENELQQPALVGHSMGGLASLMVAGKETSSIGRVVVIDALPFFSLIFNPQVKSIPQGQSQTKAIQNYIARMPDALMQMQARMVITTFTKSQDKKDLLLQWSLDSDQKIYVQYLAELLAYDGRPELKAIQSPLTVIYAYDKSMPMPADKLKDLYTTAYADKEGTQLKPVENSLHCIMWDQPEALLKVIEDTLSQPVK